MISDLIAGVYVLLCADTNCASLYPRHRIGLAGMVDIPCCISAIGAVNHPPAVQLKEIFRPEFVGFFRRDSLAPILHNELPGPNRSEGKEAEPRSRPPDTKPARSSSFSTGRLPRGTTFQLLLTLGLLHLRPIGALIKDDSEGANASLLDKWRARQPDVPTRQQAVRQILAAALRNPEKEKK